MNEKLLREFITSTLATAGNKKRNVGVLSKIKSFFKGTQGAEEIVNAWLDSAEDRYSITIPDEIEADAKKLIAGKYKAIVQRYGSTGNPQKISSTISKILDKTYGSALRELEKLADEETGLSARHDDDDDDFAAIRRIITKSKSKSAKSKEKSQDE